MRAKIIEILNRKLSGKIDVNAFIGDTFFVIADEIVELYEVHFGVDWGYGEDRATQKPSAEELNMKAVKCDCRHCQPDKWEKDTRGIWINISP